MKNLLSRLTRLMIIMLLLVDRTPNFGILANATWARLDVKVFSGSGSYVTENMWSLEKSVNTSTLNLPIGGNQDVTYTVTASKSTKHNFTFDFSVKVENGSRLHDAYYSLDARILKPNGDPLFDWKNIDSNVYIAENGEVNQTYSEDFEFIGTLPSNNDILPFKIEVRLTAPGNNDTDKSPANNSFSSSVLNESLRVIDSFDGAGPWDFTNTGSVSYVRNIEAGAVGGTHTVVNTVTGDYLEITDSVTLTVNTLNALPVADSQTYDTDEEAPINIVLTGSDADASQSISFVDIGSPTNGALSGIAPNLVYTPNKDFFGSDSFTFRVFDGFEYSPYATIAIKVANINDAPVAEDGVLQLDEGTSKDGTVSASDVDGDSLTFALGTNPSHGTVVVNPDGTYTYNHLGSETISDSFTFTVSDGTLTVTGEVIITINPVNDAPIAVDDVYSTNEDTTLTVNAANGVLSNDTDPEGDEISAIKLTNPTNGTLVYFTARGSFRYRPNPNYFGPDSFTYKVIDSNGAFSIATVTINVESVNDEPIAIGDLFSTNEDTVLTFTVEELLSNDFDPDGDILTITNFTQPGLGTLTLVGNQFTFTPNANLFSLLFPTTFKYTISDGNGGTDSAFVSIWIYPINDDPLAVDDAYAVDEDQTLIINAANGLLANDSDVDGPTMFATLATAPANGTVSISLNGRFTYIPNPDFNGTDTFEYRVRDGIGGSDIGKVTITVNPINDAPVAVNDVYSTDEDTQLVVSAPGILGNDMDIDGDVLTLELDSNVSNGTLNLNPDGSFTYMPNANYHGVDSFTYHVSDGLLDSGIATVTINVISVNDLPDAVSDSFFMYEDNVLIFTTTDLLDNDTDVDGDPLTITGFTQPGAGSLVRVGDEFTYTPNLNYFGVRTFQYTISDGNGGSDTTRVYITVMPVNDAPVAVDDEYTTYEDQTLVVSTRATGVLGNDYDVDSMIIYADLAVGGEPANGTVTISLNGRFTYIPNPDFNGVDTFTYRVRDLLGASDTGTVTVNVLPVNDAPVAVNDTYSTNEDTLLVVSAPGILGNDIDVDGDSLTFVLDTDVANGLLTLNSDGSFTYLPDSDYFGIDTFTYHVNDGTVDSNVVTVTITVTSVNDAPVASPLAFTVANAGSSTGQLIASDVDNLASELVFSLLTAPTNGSATVSPTGTYSYTHNGTTTLSDSFTFSVTDGELSATATVTVTVLAAPTPPPVNLPPVANALAFTIANGAVSTGTLTGSDPEGAPISFAIATLPANGSLAISPAGIYVYDHNGTATTSDSFTFTVSDGSLSATATVTITILAIPTPPPAGNTPPEVIDGVVSTPFGEVIEGSVAPLGSDADGDDLSFALVDGPSNGTLVFNPDGTYTYTPNDGFNGSDSFTFIANDGTDDSDTATLTINVLEEEVIVEEPETPLAAPDNNWLWWLLALLAGLLLWLLAFLRPNMKYTLSDKANNQKVVRRRLAKPDDKTMIVELNDKDMVGLTTIEVEFYKRLAKHCGDVTVKFMLKGTQVHSVTIPADIDDVFTTIIHL